MREQFEALLERKPGMRDRSRDMARAILVDGVPPAEVGRRYKVSRQAAHRASLKIAKLFYEDMDCPEGWEIVQLKLPPALANQVRELEREQLQLYTASSEDVPLQAVSG